jgi:hypothetical protein
MDSFRAVILWRRYVFCLICRLIADDGQDKLIIGLVYNFVSPCASSVVTTFQPSLLPRSISYYALPSANKHGFLQLQTSIFTGILIKMPDTPEFASFVDMVVGKGSGTSAAMVSL